MIRAVAAAVVVLALGFAATALWWATRATGVGVSADSVVYLATASDLDTRRTVTVPDAHGGHVPLTHFPPAYPLLLAAATGSAGDSFFPRLLELRKINVLLLLTTLLLIGTLTLQLTAGSGIAAAVGVLVAATSLDFYAAFGRAWSETLFLPLVLVATFLLCRWRPPANGLLLAAAGLALSLATLTRWIGLSLLAGGALCALCAGGRETSRREGWSRLAWFAAPAVLLVVPLLGHNALAADSATGRTAGLHPPGIGDLRSALETVSMWLLPSVDLPGWLLLAVGALASAALVPAMARTVLLAGRPKGTAAASAETVGLGRVGILITSYVVLLLVAMTIADDATPLDYRLLLPVHALLIALVTGAVFRLSRRRRTLAAGIGIAVLAAVPAHAARVVKWSTEASRSGIHYNRVEYRSSATACLLQRAAASSVLPEGTSIATDNPALLAFLSSRQALPCSESAPGAAAERAVMIVDFEADFGDRGSCGHDARRGRVTLVADSTAEVLVTRDDARRPGLAALAEECADRLEAKETDGAVP